MDKITLQNVLSVFDAPLNEEQAWAICFQCAVFLNHKWKTSPAECHRFKRVNSIHIDKDGHVTSIGPVSNGTYSTKWSKPQKSADHCRTKYFLSFYQTVNSLNCNPDC